MLEGWKSEEIAAKDAEIAAKDAEIAAKDAEIAAFNKQKQLKQKLDEDLEELRHRYLNFS